MEKEMKNGVSFTQVARTCHEVNKAYCESIGDTSQPDWKDAPEWQKESAINGVKYHFNNENTTAADSHNNWMKEKVENGWKYGPIKDPEKKEHHCIVTYEELPKEQQYKDSLFIAVVHSFK